MNKKNWSIASVQLPEFFERRERERERERETNQNVRVFYFLSSSFNFDSPYLPHAFPFSMYNMKHNRIM